MTTTTRDRVPEHTSEEINRRIQAEIAANVRRLAGQPKRIEARLRELDSEWDIERAIEANASALALGGVILGVTVDRRWLALPGLVAAFLFQHAIQGWCPPVPVLRRLGFRTSYEIEQERSALKALRGDFDGVAEAKDRAAAALRAAEV
jgi:hypothetical protein